MKSENRRTSGRARAGNLLIALGVVLIVYFLWINYSGRLFQNIYSYVYDKWLAQGDQDEFFAYDDLPSFLFAGQQLLPADRSPAVDTFETPGGEQITGGEESDEQAAEQQPEVLGPAVSYSQRADYVSRDMTLAVARMGIRSSVLNGTTAALLKKGPGLYDISDLPSEEGGRVVIAAHRDVYGSWFYNIDKMKQGDKMRLYFNQSVFVYEYVDTKIVEKNDWSVTEPRDYPALILTSCTPKGTSKQRIVVTGKLIDVQAISG